MNLPASSGRMVELVLAVLLLAASIYFYRRKPADGNSYGNQGAVIMLVVAVIMGMHALGLLDYRPSQSELEAMQDRAR